MTKKNDLIAALPSDVTLRGPAWHLIGAGPARWGWATYTAAGDGTYLGRTLDAALDHVTRDWGSDSRPWDRWRTRCGYAGSHH